MKVTYIGGDVCELFGKKFFGGQEQDVSDLPAQQQMKLANNPQFKADKAEKPEPAPAQRQKLKLPKADAE